jgi:hypothetical protein
VVSRLLVWVRVPVWVIKRAIDALKDMSVERHRQRLRIDAELDEEAAKILKAALDRHDNHT